MKNDSTSSGRSPYRPAELFQEIVDNVLEPLADVTAHPDSFFEGYRLLGVDGTMWSVGNTPTIVVQLPMAAKRRLQVAFARLRFVSVAEIYTRAPVAAVAAQVQEPEQGLTGKLWPKIPERSLIIGDEFFGAPRTLLEATHAVRDCAVNFLTGVRDTIKAQVLEHLSDGSAWVEVAVPEYPTELETLRIREIRAIGRAINRKRFRLRLWTTLSDPQRFPAETLARRYVMQWERELHCRDLHLNASTTPGGGAHTLETALQEAATVILASAVLARLRIAAVQRHEIPPSRMSFLQLKRATNTLWNIFEILGNTLTPLQRQRAVEHYIEAVSQTVRERRVLRYSPLPTARRLVPSGGNGPTVRPKTRRIEIEVVPV